MDNFCYCLVELNALGLETSPQTIVDLLTVLESLLEYQDKKILRTYLAPESLLHKVAVYYAGRYYQFYSARQAEFCSEHDAVIFYLARFFISAARLRLISFYLAAPLHTLLALPPLSDTVPLLHFAHVLAFRLLSDEQIAASFGVQVPVFLYKAASSLLEMVGLGVSFGIAANANLLQLLLLKMTSHEQFAPIGSTVEDYFILNRLPIATKGNVEVKATSSAGNTFENAEQAMTKQFDYLKKSMDTVYQTLSVIYAACTHLSKNNPEIASDLLFAVAKVAGYFYIKMLRFCIVPCGLRGFVRYWKRADEAIKDFWKQAEQKGQYINRRDEEAKRLDKMLYLSVYKLPSLKFIYRYREACVELAYRMMQLQIRAFYFLNRYAPQLFGKLAAEFLIYINQALYTAQMGIDLAAQDQFRGYMSKYMQPRSLLNDAYIESANELDLGRYEIYCIKQFALYFAMPYYDFYSFGNVQVYEELLAPQNKYGECTAAQLLRDILITDCDNVCSTADLVFCLYGSYLDTPLHYSSNSFIKSNLDAVENNPSLYNFIYRVNYSFYFVRKCCMAYNLRGYCVLQNFDNFYIYIAFASIFSIDAAADKPFEVLAQLISAMVEQFDNYNVTLAVYLFISSVIARQISVDYQNIRDYLYYAGKILLAPSLSGFRFNYNNIVLKYIQQGIDGDFGDLHNQEFSSLPFWQQNVYAFLQSNSLVVEQRAVLPEDIQKNVGQDIVVFDYQLITSGIIQTISLLSYLLDDMYEKFTEQLQGGFQRIKNVAGYSYVLNNVMIALIQVVMPYFMNLDKTIMENMNFLLLELFYKLALKSPLSSCPLILGLRHYYSLLLKVYEVLLGQTVQMIMQEQDNTEYVTAFLFSCLLSKHTDNVYTELLNSKILYTSIKLFPFRILTRHLFYDNLVYQKLDSCVYPFFELGARHFHSCDFYYALAVYDKEAYVIYIIGKLVSMLFESVGQTRQQQKTLYLGVVYLIFNSRYGLLSFTNPKQFCLNSATNDTQQDTTMLLMMSLSYLCRSPLNNDNMITFINYYLIYYSARFKVDSVYAIGRHLDETLISNNEVCKDLFHRWLSLCAVANADAALFSYCFTQVCHTIYCYRDHQIAEQKKDLLLYLSRNLHRFPGKLECNILVYAIGIEAFEAYICICRYLKEHNYYLDRILIDNVVVQNTHSFYDAFVKKNQLLRELYDFDVQAYEGLFPLLIEQVRARVIYPYEYIKYAFYPARIKPQNPFSNIMAFYVQALNLHIYTVYFNDETITFGVKGGDKNALWIKELPHRYFYDLRDITSVTTQIAIAHANFEIYEPTHLSLNQAAGLQLLLGKEVPRVDATFYEAINYLTLVYDDIEACKCLRYASVPLRNHLAKYIEAQYFYNYMPITDLIPNIYLYHYVKMTNGFESYNYFLMDYIQKDHGLGNYTDNHFYINTSWARETKYYSLESIHTALQIILDQSVAENVNLSMQTLVSILNNQILGLIQSSPGDLYKFINYTPLTSQVTHQLVLYTIKGLIYRFGYQMKSSANFCVLEESFYQLSLSLQSLIYQDDLIMELLNYNKTVVYYYYNKQLRRPKLNEEHYMHFQNCYLANEIAGIISETGSCSNVSRLTTRHFTYICGLPFILIVPFLLFALQHGTPEYFKIMHDAGLSGKLAELLYTMRTTKFTANVCNCFVENGYFKDRYYDLLQDLVDYCIDSPLFETILDKMDAAPEGVVFLQNLQAKTFNSRYYYAIAKYVMLNSGDLTYLELSEFMRRVYVIEQREIDYLLREVLQTYMTIFEFAQRYFVLTEEVLTYAYNKLENPETEFDVKRLCYFAAVFGAANFEDIFMQIKYFRAQYAETAVQAESKKEDDDGFVFADFEEESVLRLDSYLVSATAELVAPLLSGLPRFAVSFLTDLLQVFATFEDGAFASSSIIVLSALSCFDFSYWYEALVAGLLELLGRVDADYTAVSQVIQYVVSKDASVIQRFSGNAALVRIAGGYLEKPRDDEIHLKMGFL